MDAGLGRSRHTCRPGAVPLRDAAYDVPVFTGFQAVGGESKPVHVRSDVGQDRRASARWLAVGHPVVVPDLGRHGRAEASGAYGCAARTPQEPREGPHGHEPGSTAG